MRILKIAIIFLVTFSGTVFAGQNPGSIDLRSYPFDRQEPIVLKGSWRYYPRQLITPADVRKPASILLLPSTWNNIGETSKGYASYAVDIVLPDKAASYGLIFRDAASCYRLFVISGDKILYSNSAGSPGKNRETTIPWLSYTIASLDMSGTITILIQVSNFDINSGGMWNTPIIGSYMQTRLSREITIGKDFLLMGILLVIALFSLLLFVRSANKKAPLFLFLLCLIMILRTALTGLYPHSYITPSRSIFTILYKLDYLTIPLSVTLFNMYLRCTFPDFINRKLFILFNSVALLYSLFVIIVSNDIYSRTNFLLWSLVFINLIWIILSLLQGALSSKRDFLAVISGAALIVFSATILYDILYVLHFVNGPLIATFGFAAFISAQAYVASEVNKRSMLRIEYLATELDVLHHNFDELVNQKVKGLHELILEKRRKEQRRVSSDMQNRIAQAIQYIQENFTGDISREGLAAKANLSPSRFGKAFLACTNMTIHDYIIELRLNATLPLLAGTTKTITEIAHKTGFDSLSTFNRTFKKMIGITPTEYREKNSPHTETRSHSDL